MAASKSARKGGTGKPEDRSSVARARSRAKVGADMGGGRTRSRKALEAERSLQEPVSDLPPEPEGEQLPDLEGDERVDPGVVAAAYVKARERIKWASPRWRSSVQRWEVPSESAPGVVYLLRLRPGTVKGEKWWVRLECECANERLGRRVCWHKAIIVVHYHRTMRQFGIPPVGPDSR